MGEVKAKGSPKADPRNPAGHGADRNGDSKSGEEVPYYPSEQSSASSKVTPQGQYSSEEAPNLSGPTSALACSGPRPDSLFGDVPLEGGSPPTLSLRLRGGSTLAATAKFSRGVDSVF